MLICPRVQLPCNTEATLYAENAKCCDFQINYLNCDLLLSSDHTMHHIFNMDTSFLNLLFQLKSSFTSHVFINRNIYIYIFILQ